MRHWLVFEAQEPNKEQHTKATAGVQNAIQCYSVICDQGKKERESHYPGQTKHWVQQDPGKEVTSTHWFKTEPDLPVTV